MENIINDLFLTYLSKQNIATDEEYSKIAKSAFSKELQLRTMLNEKQTKCFEELFELTSQIHFLEVKDAFYVACKLGAKAKNELVI